MICGDFMVIEASFSITHKVFLHVFFICFFPQRSRLRVKKPGAALPLRQRLARRIGVLRQVWCAVESRCHGTDGFWVPVFVNPGWILTPGKRPFTAVGLLNWEGTRT